jgi:hypothetical protein
MGKRRTRKAERAATDKAEIEAVSTWLAEMNAMSDEVFGASRWRATHAPDPKRWHPCMGDADDESETRPRLHSV